MIFGYGLRYRGVINVFPHVEDAGDRQVKSSPGANLVPWSTPDGTLPHSERQFLLSLTLWDLKRSR